MTTTTTSSTAQSTSSSSHKESSAPLSVYLYLPNIIGYIRIILTTLSIRNYTTPRLFILLYFTSFLLDGADGLAARILNQTSEFGAILDMLTDRCSTAALLTILAHLYPSYYFICISLAFLDGYSHWLQIASALSSNKGSHKEVVGTSFLLQLYYSRAILTFVCFWTEVFFLMWYLKAFDLGWIVGGEKWPVNVVDVLMWIASPVFALKQIINVRQITMAQSLILKGANKEEQ